MATPTIQPDLTQAREAINQIDAELARLLAQRFEAVTQIAECKKDAGLPVLNSAREAQVLAQVAEAVAEPDLKAPIQQIFRDIMAESRAYQNELQRKE